MAVVEGVLEGGEEAGVLGVVVGADAEELGEFGDDVAVGVGDLHAVACGAGVAAGAAVTVGGDGFGDGGRCGEEAGRAGGHGVSLTRVWAGVLRSFALLRMTA